MLIVVLASGTGASTAIWTGIWTASWLAASVLIRPAAGARGGQSVRVVVR